MPMSVWPGEALLVRMWETLTEKGLGGLLSPGHIRRIGQAHNDVQRDALLTIAQAEREAEDIRNGRRTFTSTRKLITTGIDPETVEPRNEPAGEVALQNLAARELRGEVNVAKAFLSAEAELRSDATKPPPDKPDADWLYRWRDSASNVSADTLQDLWGRVLAGEIRSPGSFSLRTLEFLKGLSQKEAEIISKASRFVISDVIIRSEEVALTAAGVTYDILLEMQNLGIIAGVETQQLVMSFPSGESTKFVKALPSHNRALLVTAEDPNRPLSLPTYTLTTLGREVLRLGSFEADIPYLMSVGKTIKALGFDVSIAKITEVVGDSIRVSDRQEIV